MLQIASFILFLQVLSAKSKPQYFENDLGEQIARQVQESLGGLSNLGSHIRANVQQSLKTAGIPTGNYENYGSYGNYGSPPGNFPDLSYLEDHINKQIPDLSHLGEQINKQIPDLSNLGQQINQQVQQSLIPVYAMQIRHEMMSGKGGTAVVRYAGKHPRTFIIKDGKHYTCSGATEGPRCQGILQPFHPSSDHKEDYCYASSYAIINDQICLAIGGLSVNVVNNVVDCKSPSGNVLVLSRSEYQGLCGSSAPGKAFFTYYADRNNPYAIAIPNPNPLVKCKNNDPGVCEFEAEGPNGNVLVNTPSVQIGGTGSDDTSVKSSNIIVLNGY